MSDPMERAWQAVRADVDSVVLASPGALRRAGTQRTRIKVMATAFAAVVVITGVSIGTTQYFQRAAPVVGGTPSPTPTGGPTRVTSPTPSTTPSPSVEVPAGTPLDPCSTEPAKCYPPGVFYFEERLPAPCTTTQHPSNGQITARRSEGRTTYFSNNEGSTGYGMTMTRYGNAGATQYLNEVRSALTRCASVRRQLTEFDSTTINIRYGLVSRNALGGDESLLLRRTYPTEKIPEQPPTEETFLIAVIRFGDTVLVVYDYGWEGSASPRATFDKFLGESVALTRDWRP